MTRTELIAAAVAQAPVVSRPAGWRPVCAHDILSLPVGESLVAVRDGNTVYPVLLPGIQIYWIADTDPVAARDATGQYWRAVESENGWFRERGI